MALASQIPAITGKLRKRLILDISVALGGGTVAGYGYWCVARWVWGGREDDGHVGIQKTNLCVGDMACLSASLLGTASTCPAFSAVRTGRAARWM